MIKFTKDKNESSLHIKIKFKTLFIKEIIGFFIFILLIHGILIYTELYQDTTSTITVFSLCVLMFFISIFDSIKLSNIEIEAVKKKGLFIREKKFFKKKKDVSYQNTDIKNIYLKTIEKTLPHGQGSTTIYCTSLILEKVSGEEKLIYNHFGQKNDDDKQIKDELIQFLELNTL